MHGLILESGRLTIANAVTLLTTVVAGDGDADLLDGILGASLGKVAKLIAVGALLHETRDRLASVGKTSNVLLGAGRPARPLTSALRRGGEAVLNSVLLVQITLKVHVGVSRRKGTLRGNEIDGHLLASEGLLKLAVSHLGKMLEILLNGLLDLKGLTLRSCLSDLAPGDLSVDIVDHAEINLARVRAIDDKMSFSGSAYIRLKQNEGGRPGEYYPLRGSCGRAQEASAGSPCACGQAHCRFCRSWEERQGNRDACGPPDRSPCKCHRRAWEARGSRTCCGLEEVRNGLRCSEYANLPGLATVEAVSITAVTAVIGTITSLAVVPGIAIVVSGGITAPGDAGVVSNGIRRAPSVAAGAGVVIDSPVISHLANA